MRTLIAVLIAGLFLFGAFSATSQSSEFRTLVITGTSDLIVDSTLTKTYMDGKRLYINGIYWWYDNAANTNQMFVEVIRSSASFDIQGDGRQFKYSEAMTSSGIKGTSMPLNLTTGADSTIFFVIKATGSDSLYMAVNYKYVN